MTLEKLLAMSLARVGLNTTTTTFVDRARDYYNEGAKDLSGRRQWRWLFKNSTITTTASTKTYSLASDVSRPLSFINTTDDEIMRMVDIQEMDRDDPDQDETGGARFVVVSGINSTTGYWEVDLHPTPDTSSETITYRYFAFLEDKTDSDDSTDLRATMPEAAQWAVMQYVVGKYKGEKGDPVGEQQELDSYFLAVQNLAKVDGEQDGNESFQFPRRDGFLNVNFTVQDGTLG